MDDGLATARRAITQQHSTCASNGTHQRGAVVVGVVDQDERESRGDQNGLALAQRYSEQCFIGRHASTREQVPSAIRRRYIVQYWKSPTGKETRISPETCQTYDTSALQAIDNGDSGWIVADAKRFRLTVDDKDDADALMAVARRYTSHCIIGTADPAFRYPPVDYWK